MKDGGRRQRRNGEKGDVGQKLKGRGRRKDERGRKEMEGCADEKMLQKR